MGGSRGGSSDFKSPQGFFGAGRSANDMTSAPGRQTGGTLPSAATPSPAGIEKTGGSWGEMSLGPGKDPMMTTVWNPGAPGGGGGGVGGGIATDLAPQVPPAPQPMIPGSGGGGRFQRAGGFGGFGDLRLSDILGRLFG